MHDKNTLMAGLYIHIPFCASRCIYCAFYSTTDLSWQDAYVDAVCREMELRKDEMGRDGNAVPSTIYIGGGTPSQLSPKNLRKLFDHIGNTFDAAHRWDDMEITLECNPDDITDEFAEMLRTTPVNRGSMGAQTFSDERLRFLRRRHNAREVPEAVGRLRKAGIRNISVDLMFGFPDETLAEWGDDIRQALDLDVEHLSAYSLQYEEGTRLYQMLRKGQVSETDEELYRQMYDLLCDQTAAAGYEHYEISNFCRPSSHSRHNSSYWNNTPYIGLGASAHSYSGDTRSWNCDNLKEYVDSISRGILPSESETITEATHYDDTIVTALRTRRGIDLNNVNPRYRGYLMKQATPYINKGDMTHEDNHLALSRTGIYISDMIMADLMWGEE